MTQLSPRLEEILAQCADPSLADRLRQVFDAATDAIRGMADLDLVKYEHSSLDASPDLSLWEETAPVLRNTVLDVNRLLQVIREQAPPSPEIVPDASNELRQMRDVWAGLAMAEKRLSLQVARLGEQMRSPEVVSDRWNLLGVLNDARSRFREDIGELLYSAASALADVQHAEVVPGFAEDQQRAVELRAALARLAHSLEERVAQVETAAAEDVQWNGQQMLRSVDSLGTHPAFRALRTQDQRVLLEFRQLLRELASQQRVQRAELSDAGIRFLEFLRTVSSVSHRQILLLHDREVAAACGVGVEHAHRLAEQDPAHASTVLAKVLQQAVALFGRDRSLDAYLMERQRSGLEGLSDADLRQELERFVSLLAGLPLY